jgi:phosphoribosylformylglycinamidine synthase
VAVERALPALGFEGVSEVRVGKFIELRLASPPGTTAEQAHRNVDEMCRKLLANPIIEDFTFEIDAGE